MSTHLRGRYVLLPKSGIRNIELQNLQDNILMSNNRDLKHPNPGGKIRVTTSFGLNHQEDPFGKTLGIIRIGITMETILDLEINSTIIMIIKETRDTTIKDIESQEIINITINMVIITSTIMTQEEAQST